MSPISLLPSISRTRMPPKSIAAVLNDTTTPRAFATFLSPALVGRTSAAESPCAVGRLAPFLPVSHLDVPNHS